MAAGKKTGGLAGVTAGETQLCTVGKEGAGLTYRGYDIYDLATTRASKRLHFCCCTAICQRKRNSMPISQKSKRTAACPMR